MLRSLIADAASQRAISRRAERVGGGTGTDRGLRPGGGTTRTRPIESVIVDIGITSRLLTRRLRSADGHGWWPGPGHSPGISPVDSSSSKTRSVDDQDLAGPRPFADFRGAGLDSHHHGPGLRRHAARGLPRRDDRLFGLLASNPRRRAAHDDRAPGKDLVQARASRALRTAAVCDTCAARTPTTVRIARRRLPDPSARRPREPARSCSPQRSEASR